MGKFIRLFIMTMVLVGMAAPSFAAAPTTQVDSLIQLLIDKKILTESEAANLKSQIAYDEKEIRSTNLKSDIPQWVQDMKVSGDFRLRHEFSHRNDAADQDRNRGRVRARLNFETNVNDKVKVGIGIATDGGSGRSNNQSFGSTFAKGNIVLNKAYAEYTPNDRIKLVGGKMNNPIWEPMEFLWDADLTPEGGALISNYKVSDSLNLLFMASAFQLSEISTSEADPFMYVLQGGVQGKLLGEKADYKILGMFNGMDNVDKNVLANRSATATNTTNPAGQYVFHYSQPVVGVELGVNDPLGEWFPLYIPRVGIFGEYTKNPSPSERNVAWMLGGYMGNSKVSGWGTWKMTGAMKTIGQDAWLDALPDSDFYGGATDVKGYENILEIGIAKNVSVSLDYYRTERIKTTKQQESLLQTDINFKF